MAKFEFSHNNQRYEIEAPDQQSAIDAFTQFTKPTPLQDVRDTIGPGLVRGTAAAATAPRNVLDQAISGLGSLGASQGVQDVVRNAANNAIPFTRAFSGNQITKAVEDNVTGPLYQPQTPYGEYANTGAEFLPGALLGGVNSLREIPKAAVNLGILPAAVSETAGQLTKGTPYEGVARGAGALLGGVGGSMLNRPATASQAISRELGNMTEAELRPIVIQAEGLIRNSAQNGINLTWAQAIDQVAPGATNLPKLQRYIERTETGANALKPFYADQPQAMRQAVTNEMDNITPPSQTPSTIGPTAAANAQRSIDETQGAINQSTRPLYDASRADVVPQAQYNASLNDPSFRRALETVRNHPELNAGIENLPNNSVAVVDRVTKFLERQAATGTNGPNAIDNFLASNRSAAANEAENLATRSSQPYAQAQAEQAIARQNQLNPMQQGPLGGIARAQDTRTVTQTLFPKNPLAGSEGEVADTVRNLAGRDRPNTLQVIRQHIDDTANRTMTDKADYYGGKRFVDELVGNPQQRRNMQAATDVIGARTGVDELLETLQATGRRLPEGSQTATDLMRDKTSTSRFWPNLRHVWNAGEDVYQTWRHKSAAQRTADLLMNPDAGEELIRALNARQSTPSQAILLNMLLAPTQGR